MSAVCELPLRRLACASSKNGVDNGENEGCRYPTQQDSRDSLHRSQKTPRLRQNNIAITDGCIRSQRKIERGFEVNKKPIPIVEGRPDECLDNVEDRNKQK